MVKDHVQGAGGGTAKVCGVGVEDVFQVIKGVLQGVQNQGMGVLAVDGAYIVSIFVGEIGEGAGGHQGDVCFGLAGLGISQHFWAGVQHKQDIVFFFYMAFFNEDGAAAGGGFPVNVFDVVACNVLS